MDFVNHTLEMYLLRLFFGFSYFFYIDALNIPFVSTMFTLKFSSGRGEVGPARIFKCTSVLVHSSQSI